MARGKGSQFRLNDYEQPLGEDEIARTIGVFETLLLSGPGARSLLPLLRELTEEQLSQVSRAALTLYKRASHMQGEKTRHRVHRNAVRGGKTSAESKERALAS